MGGILRTTCVLTCFTAFGKVSNLLGPIQTFRSFCHFRSPGRGPSVAGQVPNVTGVSHMFGGSSPPLTHVDVGVDAEKHGITVSAHAESDFGSPNARRCVFV